ncbi:Crp/Fnr family transcriptional regulator [Chryseobacterium shandongense]|uniref:Crp/Fnr family transcriptional regulator n=1 Tax=Chryseobacterium shandongense TaxID=1493872 RepID=A0AAD0YDD8_9FLAO|nr:Crp/Fnr family transcriptional regulator [Chryseobacterium shandongense]AZA85478.1 Crp/Fnr family transcriptional regulator [Chryseobacterium shandongense]AZA97585.1 Crp/Fnr family transcriptional regulator [Chryseobacterium shandongense]
MKQLFDYINSYLPNGVSEDEFTVIKSYFKHKVLRKRQYFLREGDICRFYGFIVSGSMRQYSVDEYGAEFIVQLFIENWWVGDRESFRTAAPSVYNIDAWEQTELLLITRSDVLELLNRSPAFAEMVRGMDDRNSAATLKRITSSISSGAEKRYSEFVSNYPEFVQRFPQHVIASYLGISKDTLSRIKRQMLNK